MNRKPDWETNLEDAFDQNYVRTPEPNRDRLRFPGSSVLASGLQSRYLAGPEDASAHSKEV